jgi:site-specific DNA-methyltransferase (adenine-specific)
MKIIHGRSEEASSWEGVEDVAFCLTSPPFNIGLQYGPGVSDRLPEDVYVAMVADSLDRVKRRLRPGGSVMLELKPASEDQDPTLPWMLMLYLCRLRGWTCQNQLCWVKTATTLDEAGEEVSWGHFRPTPGLAHPHSGWEHVYHLRPKGTPKVPLDRLALGVPYSVKSNLTRSWKKLQCKGCGGPSIKKFENHPDGRTDMWLCSNCAYCWAPDKEPPKADKPPKTDKRCRGNVLEVPYKTITQRGTCPCPYPVELATTLLRLLGARPGDLVVDPFAGSGTTGQAARELGCGFHGVEASLPTVEEARARLSILAVDW